MNDRTRALLKVLLRLLVTAALLAAVFCSIDMSKLWQTALRVRVPFLLAVFALYLLSFGVRSFRFHLILKVLDCSVSTLRVFWASAITALYSLVLPGLVSAGVKWYILKEQTGRASRVLSSMAYNQLSEMVVKILIGLLALIWANPSSSTALPFICAGLAFFVILSCILLLNKVTGPPVNRLFRRLLSPLPHFFRSKAEIILGHIETFQTVGWRFHLNMVALSLLASLVGVLIYVSAAHAAGVSVPVLALAWQCSVVFILSRLPITLANLGLRELALVEFLALYGVAKPDALLMSLVIFSGVLFVAAIGALCQLLGPFPRKTLSD